MLYHNNNMVPLFTVTSVYLSIPGYFPEPCQLFAISDWIYIKKVDILS